MPGETSERAHLHEHLVKHPTGFGLDRPVYRFGTPRLRIGSRFFRLRWGYWVALFVVLAAIAIAVCKSIVGSGGFTAFAAENPCVLPDQGSFDYPGWLRALHWFNVLLMLIFLKSGIQILADHPRLYKSIHSTPDREWLRFRGPVPKDRIWTALDDSTYLSSWIGLPGGRHTSGTARQWHFFAIPFWVATGALFIVLLFATGQWRQIVPTTWEMIPSAVTCGVTYGSLQVPAAEATAQTLNSLQLLVYFSVVFFAAPLLILTGLAQSPAVSHYYRWFIRLFGNRQIARSLHFLLWVYIAVFLVIHVILVISTGLLRNMNHIVMNNSTEAPTGLIVGIVILAVIAVVIWWANRASWKSPRKVQHAYQRIAGHMNTLIFGGMAPRVQWKESDVSPYLWTNGPLPKTDEYEGLLANDFADYRLEVGGMCESPHSFSLDELKAMGKSVQITEHDCVQGWSGVAKWGGVQIKKILDVAKPTSEARFVLFRSFEQGAEGGTIQYYDIHDLWQMYEDECILAYEMNDEQLPVPHGRPLRLRNERQVGYKQIKWIKSMELISEYADIYGGEGGFRPDNEYQARSGDI